MTMKSKSFKAKARGAVSALALSLALASTAGAQAHDGETLPFEIEAQPLSEALLEFSRQAGVNVIAPSALTRGLTSEAVSGDMSPSQALTALIGDAKLTLNEQSDGSVVLIAQRETAERDTRATSSGAAGTYQGSVQPVDARETQTTEAEPDEGEGGEDAEGEEGETDVITVTGTNIRGAAPDSSPSFVFTREDIDLSGATTLPEFIRTLPQSFGGGVQAGVLSLPNDDVSTSNIGAGSSINLRGLGSGSTLVLLNGKRIAPGGALGGFADISMIPVSAIERIEMITDGASAIYGADAVGGVVNIVLRDDYAGVQTFAGIGSDSGGDVIEYRVGATFGRAWRGGNLIASYDFSDRGALSAADREFSAATPTPNDLLPSQEAHSGLMSISQDVGSNLSLQAEATHSHRLSSTTRNIRSTISTRNSEIDQSSISIDAAVDIVATWQLVASAAYSRYFAYRQQFISDGQLQSDAESDSNVLSFGLRADGSLIALPGGSLLAAFGAEYREEDFEFSVPLSDRIVFIDDRRVSSAYAELFIPIIGEPNSIPGVQRLEMTVAGRQDSYSDFGDAFSPKLGVAWAPNGSILIRSSYGESFNPPDLGRTGGTTGGIVRAWPIPNTDSPSGTSVSIVDFRSPDLGPEESTTWTFGVDYNRQVGGGQFAGSVTWYDISYQDRIASPGDFRRFLNNPDVFASLITPNPDPNVISALVNDPDVRFFINPASGWTAPGDEEFLLDARLANLSSQDTSGVDFDFSYEIDPGAGQLELSLNAAYIIEQVQRITATAAAEDAIDTIFRPADFRFRAGATWSLDSWTLAGFVNHVDGYTDNRDLNGLGDVEVDAWTTFDLSLIFRSNSRHQIALLNNLNVALNARNVFDEEPPSIIGSADNFGLRQGYDPANADPLGRFVTLRVTKEW